MQKRKPKDGNAKTPAHQDAEKAKNKETRADKRVCPKKDNNKSPFLCFLGVLASWRLGVTVFLCFLLLCPVSLHAQDVIEVRDLSDPQKPVIAKASVSTKKSRVANPVILTFTVEGPSGLEVQLPEKILKPESGVFWRVNKYPPTQVTKGQTIIWKYEFECAAFTEGDLPIAIAPLKIRRKGDADITLEFTQSLVVNTFIGVASPGPENLRSATEIETLPKLDSPSQSRSLNFWLILLVPPVVGIPLAHLLWKKPPPVVVQEVCDRMWLLQRLHPQTSPDQAAQLFIRYLQSQSKEVVGNPIAMIGGLPELADDEKTMLIGIYQQLEQERFTPSDYHQPVTPTILKGFILALEEKFGSKAF